MSQRTCAIDSCPNMRKRQGGRCETHYRHAVAAGEIALPASLCTVDDCRDPEFCADLCSKHYKRVQRWGVADDPRPAHGDTCALNNCAEPYYASQRCRRHYKRDHQRKVRATAKAERRRAGPELWACIDCGRVEVRSPGGGLPLRCVPCAAEAIHASKRAYAAAHAPPRALEYRCTYCGCAFCNIVPDGRLRTVCAGCQGAMKTRSTRRWQAAHPEQAARLKAIGQQRRRAMLWDPAADHIDRLVVFERDGWCCHLCQQAIEPHLAYPNPWSASLDHVLPLSKTGTHTYDNVAASHWLCNIRRGARLLVM